jgi:hypothetical protein
MGGHTLRSRKCSVDRTQEKKGTTVPFFHVKTSKNHLGGEAVPRTELTKMALGCDQATNPVICVSDFCKIRRKTDKTGHK